LGDETLPYESNDKVMKIKIMLMLGIAALAARPAWPMRRR